MKNLLNTAIIILTAITLMSCATLAAQPQEPVDESQAVAESPETKPVDAYVWIPRKTPAARLWLLPCLTSHWLFSMR